MKLNIFELLQGILPYLDDGATVDVPAWDHVIKLLSQATVGQYGEVLSSYIVKRVNTVETLLGAATHLKGKEMDMMRKATVKKDSYFLQ